MNLSKCLFKHDWVHVSDNSGFYQECESCGKTKPDPEMEQFAKFCIEGRKQGLNTEDLRAIVLSRGMRNWDE